jgi:hypothetical protein
MDKITQISENVVRCKYFEAGVHIENPIKNSYQDGLGRTTQTLDHVVVVHNILIWDKRKSQINDIVTLSSCEEEYHIIPDRPHSKCEWTHQMFWIANAEELRHHKKIWMTIMFESCKAPSPEPCARSVKSCFSEYPDTLLPKTQDEFLWDTVYPL